MFRQKIQSSVYVWKLSIVWMLHFIRKSAYAKHYQFYLLIILKLPSHYYFTDWNRDSSLPYQAQWSHMEVEDMGWWRGFRSQRLSDGGYGQVESCMTKWHHPYHSTHQQYLAKCNTSMNFSSMPKWDFTGVSGEAFSKQYPSPSPGFWKSWGKKSSKEA